MLRGIDVNEVIEAIKGHRAPTRLCWPPCSSRRLFHIDILRTCSPSARSAARRFPTASTRSLPSPAIRSGIMSAPASLPARGALSHLFGVGLNAIDVAKICFPAGLTFWLGNAAVLGLGIL